MSDKQEERTQRWQEKQKKFRISAIEQVYKVTAANGLGEQVEFLTSDSAMKLDDEIKVDDLSPESTSWFGKSAEA